MPNLQNRRGAGPIRRRTRQTLTCSVADDYRRFWHLAFRIRELGSVQSEPGGVNHFARTDAEPAFVEISGFGPTDTRYF